MNDAPTLSRRLAAEALGSFFLFATVIGSGVMAEALAGGNVAIALLGNTLVTSRLESLFGLAFIAAGLPLYLKLKGTRNRLRPAR